jgi:hypothetical protein
MDPGGKLEEFTIGEAASGFGQMPVEDTPEAGDAVPVTESLMVGLSLDAKTSRHQSSMRPSSSVVVLEMSCVDGVVIVEDNNPRSMSRVDIGDRWANPPAAGTPLWERRSPPVLGGEWVRHVVDMSTEEDHWGWLRTEVT